MACFDKEGRTRPRRTAARSPSTATSSSIHDQGRQGRRVHVRQRHDRARRDRRQGRDQGRRQGARQRRRRRSRRRPRSSTCTARSTPTDSLWVLMNGNVEGVRQDRRWASSSRRCSARSTSPTASRSTSASASTSADQAAQLASMAKGQAQQAAQFVRQARHHADGADVKVDGRDVERRS